MRSHGSSSLATAKSPKRHFELRCPSCRERLFPANRQISRNLRRLLYQRSQRTLGTQNRVPGRMKAVLRRRWKQRHRHSQARRRPPFHDKIRRRRHPPCPESQTPQALPQHPLLRAQALPSAPCRAAGRRRRQRRQRRQHRRHQARPAPLTLLRQYRRRHRWPISSAPSPSQRPKLLRKHRFHPRNRPPQAPLQLYSLPVFLRSPMLRHPRRPPRLHPPPVQPARAVRPRSPLHPLSEPHPPHPYHWGLHPPRRRPPPSPRPPTSVPVLPRARPAPVRARSAPLRPFRFQRHAPNARLSPPPPGVPPAAIPPNSLNA